MLVLSWLMGKRGPRKVISAPGAAGDAGFGAKYAQAWEFRPLPGAGANQWAWETLALPLYSPIGWGTRNRRQFYAQGGEVFVAVQGTTLTPLGGSPIGGDLTAQFVTQPLLDVQQAESSGFMTSYVPPANQWEMPNTALG